MVPKRGTDHATRAVGTIFAQLLAPQLFEFAVDGDIPMPSRPLVPSPPGCDDVRSACPRTKSSHSVRGSVIDATPASGPSLPPAIEIDAFAVELLILEPDADAEDDGMPTLVMTPRSNHTVAVARAYPDPTGDDASQGSSSSLLSVSASALREARLAEIAIQRAAAQAKSAAAEAQIAAAWLEVGKQAAKHEVLRSMRDARYACAGGSSGSRSRLHAGSGSQLLTSERHSRPTGHARRDASPVPLLRSLTPPVRNYMPPPVLLEAPEEVEESQLYRETASQPMQPNAMDVAAATLKRARVDSGASHHSITPPMRLVPESPPAASTAQSSQTSHELDKAIGGRLR